MSPKSLRKATVLYFLMCCLAGFSHAQSLPTPARMLDQVSDGGTLPTTLLQDRSVLIISAQPKANGAMPPSQSKEWATTLQAMCARQGVDVVACFQMLDLLSGREPWAAFEQLLVDRGLRHLLWLQEQENGTFKLVVAALPEEAPLLGSPINGWTVEGSDMDVLSENFRRALVRAGLPRENFMVLEVPEFFSDVPMITKGRYESFPLDLKLDKIAIRWPEGAAEAAKSEFITLLDSLYPYDFGIEPASQTDQQLRSDGYQYVLDWVYATGSSLRQVFNYPIKEGETTYITFMTLGPGQNDIKDIGIYVPVYKYYMRHLLTGDIYLGEQWDADTQWQESLRNFVYNYRAWAATRR